MEEVDVFHCLDLTQAREKINERRSGGSSGELNFF